MKNPTQYHVIDGYKGNDHWFMPKVPETATKICVSDSITGVNHHTIDDLLFSFKAIYVYTGSSTFFATQYFRYNHDTLFAFIGFMNIPTLITDGEIVLSNDYELNVPYYSDGRKILNL